MTRAADHAELAEALRRRLGYEADAVELGEVAALLAAIAESPEPGPLAAPVTDFEPLATRKTDP